MENASQQSSSSASSSQSSTANPGGAAGEQKNAAGADTGKKNIFNLSDIEFEDIPNPPTPDAEKKPDAEEVDAKEETDEDRKKDAERHKRKFKKLSHLIVSGCSKANLRFFVPMHDDMVVNEYSREVRSAYLDASKKMDKREPIVLTPEVEEIMARQDAYYKAAKWSDQDKAELEEDWSDALGEIGMNGKVNPWVNLCVSMVIMEGPIVAPLLWPKVKSLIKSIFGRSQQALPPAQPAAEPAK